LLVAPHTSALEIAPAIRAIFLAARFSSLLALLALLLYWLERLQQRGRRVQLAAVDGDDVRGKRLALAMNEAGQPHHARWIMHRAVAAEPSGERLLQRLEILERYLAGEAPIGVEATRRGFHHDVGLQLGAVHR